MAARRELRERDRDRDRGRNGHDAAWDNERPRERDRDRGTNADDRDGRAKRANGRDRRAGSGDEGKDREDRREREREREKEKEPAWMDTYVPTNSSGGILGGRTADGEMDSIQAWKKSMKEKEEKEKKGSQPSGLPATAEKSSSTGESQLDEIQMFKLIMKREEEKKKAGDAPVDSSLGPTPATPSVSAESTQPPGLSPNGNYTIYLQVIVSNFWGF